MKRIVILLLVLTQLVAVEAASEALSVEQQRDIIEMYQYVTGQGSQIPSSLSELDEKERPPIHCGTPAILDFLNNYDRLDRALLTSMGVELGERPSLAFQYDAPSGLIRIHYATAGDDKVRDAEIDVNSNGVPDYVEAVGLIADSVYAFTIDSLGYPPPLVDTTCNNGGDDRVDVYLKDLGSGIFGLTWPDTLCPLVSTNQSVPSWIELDNDYTDIAAYKDRPLDAVRVTLAHEFFHTIHFTIDLTESRELFEMTAVWMEEQQYDDINDYYSLMPFFFQRPRRSLQSQFEFHHYASVLFPLYLSENYGPDIIRHIWTRAGELGAGTDWLRATDEALDSATTGVESFATAVQEFAIWNYFTGQYSLQAPNGIGYSEKEFYPEIPVEEMLVIDSFPGVLLNNENTMSPELNGVAYVRFENIQAILTPEYWQCDSGSFDSVCYDSSYVVDTFFNMFVSLSRNASYWGAVFLQESENNPDSHEVRELVIPGNGDLLIDLPGVSAFRTITMILTPTSTLASQYQNFPIQPFGYFLYDSSGAVVPDPVFVNRSSKFLVPYPNPAVVPTMGRGAAADKGQNIWFRFQIPTDSEAELQYTIPLYRLDLYTIAGELVRTLEVEVVGVQADRDNGPPVIEYETSWDMKNEQGEDAVSGVYLVYAHLYSDISRDNLIAEDRAKVVIIR